MLRVRLYALSVVLIAFGIVLFAPASSALAQSSQLSPKDSATFARIVEMSATKGFKVKVNDDLCDALKLRSQNKQCILYGFSSDPDPTTKLNVYTIDAVRLSSGRFQILLAYQTTDDEMVSFLPTIDGSLVIISHGVKSGNQWHWGNGANTPTATDQALFNKTVAFWIAPEQQADMAKLPNRQ